MAVRGVRPLALMAVLALGLAGCAPDASAEPRETRIGCLLTSGGGASDAGVAAQTFAAVQDAREAGVLDQTSSQRVVGVADAETALDRFAAEGCDLIIAVGSPLAEPAVAAAEEMPDTVFVLVDAEIAQAPANVARLVFDPTGPAFVAGYIAASQSRTGTLATFGALPQSSTRAAMDGFAAGAEHYAEEHDAEIELLGWQRDTQEGVFTESLTDVDRAQRVSQEFLEGGADVIYPVAGPAGAGAGDAIEEAEEIRAQGTPEPADPEGDPDAEPEDAVEPATGPMLLVWHGADGAALLPVGMRSRVLASVALEAGDGLDAVLDGWDVDDEESTEDPAAERPPLAVAQEEWIGDLADGGVALIPPSDVALRSGGTLQAEIDKVLRQIDEGEIELPER